MESGVPGSPGLMGQLGTSSPCEMALRKTPG